jgi:threonine dehydrogenase-like Zn-dependent dehydrogenase
VLVIGAGLQGLGAVHWLRNLRPQDEVTCLARHGFQADLARALGAPQVLTGHIGAPELAQRLGTTCIKGLAGNDVLLDGFDAVIDSIGTPQTLQSALRWTRPGGQVVILGVHLAAGTLDYSPVWYRQVQLCGVMAHGMEMFEGRQVPTLQLALELLASRAPLPVNLVTHRVALREFPSALEIYDNRRSAAAVRVAICPA